MRKNFDKSLLNILEYEGKFSNRKADKGGPTNLGITLRTLQNFEKLYDYGDFDGDGDVDIDDIIALDTPEEAAPIYKKFFWDAMKLDDFPKGVDFLMFDFGVNSGPGNARKILQRALNRFGANLYVDGIVGGKTKAMISKVETEPLIKALLLERDIFYRKIVAVDETQIVNLKGWLNRLARLTIDVRQFMKDRKSVV